VAKITTAGVVTEYSAGIDSCADPYGIAAGPDGNIWFLAAYDGQALYKISPSSGQITTMAHASPGAQPNNILVGPDGNLWFAEIVGAIGRYNIVTGVVTEFPVPSTSSQPYDIVNGPDGAIWFTEYNNIPGNGAIGRITTSGVVTEYSTGITPNSGPNGMTLGSDGNLWFVEANIGALASINPLNPAAGGHEYLIPASAANGGAPSPIFITTGSDGNLWFTEWNNVIGRVNPLTITATWTQVGASATPAPGPTPCESDKDDLHQKAGHDNHDHEINKPWKDCRTKTKPPHHNGKK
jgi:virginiamycin B lyase